VLKVVGLLMYAVVTLFWWAGSISWLMQNYSPFDPTARIMFWIIFLLPLVIAALLTFGRRHFMRGAARSHATP
jgi:hypothetical protein